MYLAIKLKYDNACESTLKTDEFYTFKKSPLLLTL